MNVKTGSGPPRFPREPGRGFFYSRSSRSVAFSRRSRCISVRSAVVRRPRAGPRPDPLGAPSSVSPAPTVELPPQGLRRPPGPHQLDHLAAELRGYAARVFGIVDSSPQRVMSPPYRVTPSSALGSGSSPSPSSGTFVDMDREALEVLPDLVAEHDNLRTTFERVREIVVEISGAAVPSCTEAIR